MAPKPASCVALRHVDFEDLGLLAPILRAAGYGISYQDVPANGLDDSEIEACDLLVVLGGPMGVYESTAYPFLAAETAILRRRLAQGRPTLGICLGSQLMARALGADVFPGPTKEIGWGTVELTEAGKASCLAALGDDAPVLHWHGDTFSLPAGASRLVSNTLYQNQAFSHERHALGLQFHLEADPNRLEQWYIGHAAELALAGIDISALRARTADVSQRLVTLSSDIFGSWLRQIR